MVRLSMRRITAPSWTSEEVEALRGMVRGGVSLMRAGVALRRPANSVRLKARELGIPFSSKRELKRECREREANARAAAGLPMV